MAPAQLPISKHLKTYFSLSIGKLVTSELQCILSKNAFQLPTKHSFFGVLLLTLSHLPAIPVDIVKAVVSDELSEEL